MSTAHPESAFSQEMDLRFQRMIALARQRNEKLQEFLATQVQSIECPEHRGTLRVIDPQLSAAATAESGLEKAAYLPCPHCEAEHALSLENERLHKQGVPENMLHCTFENWTPRNAAESEHLDAIKQFTNLRRGFLVMLGEVATGKSHLTVAVMRHFPKALFRTQSTLLLKLRRTYSDNKAEDPIEACQRVELLVIDEMGLSSGGRDEFPMLHEILNYRHGERLPTILTGNIEWPELKEIVGPRLSDRLRESAFKVLSFGGDSHRPGRRADYLR